MSFNAKVNNFSHIISTQSQSTMNLAPTQQKRRKQEKKTTFQFIKEKNPHNQINIQTQWNCKEKKEVKIKESYKLKSLGGYYS